MSAEAVKQAVVHLLSPDGISIYCRGFQLITMARPLDRDPLRVTIRPDECSCAVCVQRWMRTQN